MGRQTKLMPQIQMEICDTIRATGCKRDAALLAGLTEGTLYNWIKKGRRAKSGKYFKFLQAIEKAELQYKNSLIGAIRRSGRGDPKRGIRPQWQANAWLLERKYPEEFGKYRIFMKKIENGEAIVDEFVDMSDAELVELAGYANKRKKSET